MKKTVALILAALMLLSMGLAYAAPASEKEPSANDKEKSFFFNKRYVDKDGNLTKAFPHETLKFKITADDGNPSPDPGIKLGNSTVDANPDEIELIVPAYTQVGKYVYTITEEAGSAQGVTYSTESFKIQVSVTYDVTDPTRKTLLRQIVFMTGDPDNKLDTITNVYKLGGDPPPPGGDYVSSVKKTVDGNMGDLDQLFEITVEFESDKAVLSDIAYSGGSDASATGTVSYKNDWTKSGEKWTASKTIKIKHDETVKFLNIPVGVKYTVVEADAHKAKEGLSPAERNAELNDPSKGYDVSGEVTSPEAIELGKTKEVTVKNTKNNDVRTGITLETLPYILVLALVVVGVAVMLIRRRRRNDD